MEETGAYPNSSIIKSVHVSKISGVPYKFMLKKKKKKKKRWRDFTPKNLGFKVSGISTIYQLPLVSQGGNQK